MSPPHHRLNVVFTYESTKRQATPPYELHDDDGKPLVRDCYCRGDSAGFAHQSCIVQFNEQKSKEATAKDDPSSFNAVTFAEYWRTCPNCKQRYQKQLSVDLTSAFVSFAERAYGHDGNSDMDKLE